jgi:hypothetical protein
MVVTIGEDLIATRTDTPPDGTLTIQPQLDESGRMARSGGNTNYGYSGYFRAYVYLGGQRKRLVNFWTLFPDRGHAYAAQQLKSEAEAAIREKIASLAGTQVRKVKGGYAFHPLATARRRMDDQVPLRTDHAVIASCPIPTRSSPRH